MPVKRNTERKVDTDRTTTTTTTTSIYRNGTTRGEFYPSVFRNIWKPDHTRSVLKQFLFISHHTITIEA